MADTSRLAFWLTLFLLTSISLTLASCQKDETESNSVAEEEIHFSSGNILLAGTLFIPNKNATSPAIAITHGSGKDMRSSGFRSLAAKLAAEGFVVLIYDKRGV